MNRILNFGSLNIDYVYDVPAFVKKGETVSSYKRSTFTGGKGLNQTVAMQRAGLKVWHAGMIGEEGVFLKEYLDNEGADTSLIKTVSESTGHAVIQRDIDGDNCILLYGGANRQITKEYVDTVLAGFDDGDFIVLQNEISELKYIIDRASEKGMKVILNPSPINEEIFKLSLLKVDIFFVNEIEGAALAGCSEGEDASIMTGKILDKFPDSLTVLTLGEKGAVCRDKDGYTAVEAKKVKAVDTTAAGDTFTGYFLAGLVLGMSNKECMELATEASAITVTRPGAAPSIPYINEITG